MSLQPHLEQTFAPVMENAVNYTQWVLAQFGDAIGSNIVEVGIGHGGYSRYMPRGASYCGVDIDPNNVEGGRGCDIPNPNSSRWTSRPNRSCGNSSRSHRIRFSAATSSNIFATIALPSATCCVCRLLGGSCCCSCRRFPRCSTTRIAWRDIIAAVPSVRYAPRFRLRAGSSACFISIQWAPWGWFANKFVRHHEIDSGGVAAQIAFFDHVLVPVSRIADRLTGWTFGQSLVAIVGKS
jgi:hypothetical protein